MLHDIIGEWDVQTVDKGKESAAGRFAFVEHDGKVVVKDADPDVAGKPARVEFDGDIIRFEFLSAGSSRGNTHHNYELRLHGPDAFDGTRRRGMLAKTSVVGRRIGVAPAVVTPSPASTSLAPLPGNVAAAKAKAAEAAERASVAAAEAAAALAEAEAVAAMEQARRAAERAAAARAAVVPPEPVLRPPVAPDVLATLPAPTEPPAFVPMAPVAQAPAASGSPEKRSLGITHRLTYGDSAVLAAEVFQSVFVWGGSFAASEQRLREAGWEIASIETDETIGVDELLLRHAAMIRDSVAS